MKKLIAILLALMLLVPVFSSADDSDVVGCWATYMLTNVGSPMMTMLYLAEDHTCYFAAQYFHSDEAGPGRTYIGTWEMQDDQYVIAKTGENTETILYLSKSHQAAMETKTGRLFINLSAFD